LSQNGLTTVLVRPRDVANRACGGNVELYEVLLCCFNNTTFGRNGTKAWKLGKGQRFPGVDERFYEAVCSVFGALFLNLQTGKNRNAQRIRVARITKQGVVLTVPSVKRIVVKEYFSGRMAAAEAEAVELLMMRAIARQAA
jgi:hypothetical protein